MKQVENIIIGAGPGGLACAKRLAEQGREVLVLERREVIGPKVCAGGITWSGLVQVVPEALFENTFPDQYVRTNLQHIRISEQEPIIATINRTKLGQWMADKALAAGARIMTGAMVQRIDQGSHCSLYRYREQHRQHRQVPLET